MSNVTPQKHSITECMCVFFQVKKLSYCSPPVADVNYGVKNILDIFIKSTQFFMAALSIVLGQYNLASISQFHIKNDENFHVAC